MEPFRLFRRSSLSTQCEECHLTYDLGRLGACVSCRRVLCNAHLHGSWTRRLLIDMGFGQPVCPRCRQRGGTSEQ